MMFSSIHSQVTVV